MYACMYVCMYSGTVLVPGTEVLVLRVPGTEVLVLRVPGIVQGTMHRYKYHATMIFVFYAGRGICMYIPVLYRVLRFLYYEYQLPGTVQY